MSASSSVLVASCPPVESKTHQQCRRSLSHRSVHSRAAFPRPARSVRTVVIATGAVSSVTGAPNTATAQGAADGAGAVASFYDPWGITTDGVSLFVVEQGNNIIRRAK